MISFVSQRVHLLYCTLQPVFIIIKDSNILFLFLFFYFMWKDVLPESTSIYHLSAWCPKRPEEGIGSLGTSFTDSYEYHVGAGYQT